jgi:hypothetical protein
MPQGYYTIEQWTPAEGGAAGDEAGWVAVCTLPFGATQTQAEAALEKRGQHGFYRLVQMQRVIWAQREGTKLRLRKAHATSPKGLDGLRAMFERCGGKYPEEEVRAARARQKAKRRARR